MSKATEDRLFVIATGLCYQSVCVPEAWDHERILNNVMPSGTRHGWQISKDHHFHTGETNPCECEQEDGRMHYLLVC